MCLKLEDKANHNDKTIRNNYKNYNINNKNGLVLLLKIHS